jgi:hypothetical protein
MTARVTLGEVERAAMEAQDYRWAGNSTPGGPGHVYVSEAAIAQQGEREVRRQVRGIYRAAYAKLPDPPPSAGEGGGL